VAPTDADNDVPSIPYFAKMRAAARNGLRLAIGTELTGIPLHRVVSEAAPTSHRLVCPTTTDTHSRRSQKLPDP
jgi:hypothetical protein